MSANQHLIEDEDIAGGQDVSYSSTSGVTAAPLSVGRWMLIATSDCHVARVAGSGAAVADTTSFFLKANTYMPLVVREADVPSRAYVAAIRASVDGTLRIRRVSRSV